MFSIKNLQQRSARRYWQNRASESRQAKAARLDEWQRSRALVRELGYDPRDSAAPVSDLTTWPAYRSLSE